MSYAIGLDIGGTKIAGAVFSAQGDQWGEIVRTETPKNYEAFLEACQRVVGELSDRAGGACSVGLCLPGAIDHEKGTLFVSANLPFLAGEPFCHDFSQRLGTDVRIANDANAMALAEAMDGAGEGAESVLGLIMGTGIGAGFIYRGQIVDGPNGMTGEVGHLPLPYREAADGPLTPCGCGQTGCIEKAIAGPALAKLYAFMTNGPEKDSAQIAEEALAGQSEALRVLDYYYEIVAKAMVTVIHAFDPYVITVSGGLNGLPGLYEEVPKRWGKYCYVKNPKTRFVPAKHGSMAGLRGAAWLGREKITT